MVTGQREQAADGIYTHTQRNTHMRTHSDVDTGDGRFNHFGEKVEGSDGTFVSARCVSLDPPHGSVAEPFHPAKMLQAI